MTNFDPKPILLARLRELGERVTDIDSQLQQPLSADFSEQAGDLEDQEALEAIEGSARHEIRAIHNALTRISNGSYGTCVDCGKNIPTERLKAVPTAMRCVACEEISQSR